MKPKKVTKKVSVKKVVSKSVARRIAIQKAAPKRIKSMFSKKDLKTDTIRYGDVGKRTPGELAQIKGNLLKMIDDVQKHGGIILVHSNKEKKAASYFKQVNKSDIYQLVFNATRERDECITEAGENVKKLFAETVDQVVLRTDCPLHEERNSLKDLLMGGKLGKGDDVHIKAKNIEEAVDKIRQFLEKNSGPKKKK